MSTLFGEICTQKKARAYKFTSYLKSWDMKNCKDCSRHFLTKYDGKGKLDPNQQHSKPGQKFGITMKKMSITITSRWYKSTS